MSSLLRAVCASMHARVRAVCTVSVLAVAATVVFTARPALAVPPADGDWVVVSRQLGSIIAIDPETGTIRGTVSGPDIFTGGTLGMVGSGPLLSGSFESRLIQMPGSQDLYVRITTNEGFGLYRIDVLTGDRTLVPGTSGANWSTVGAMIAESPTSILAVSDNFNLGGGNITSRVLRFDLSTNQTTVLSSQTIGSGPNIRKARGAALLSPTSLVVAESGLGESASNGRGVFIIDLETGDRRFLSRLSPQPFTRTVWTNGVQGQSETFGDDDGGSGPVVTTNTRELTVIGGRILQGFSIKVTDGYDGGVMEIDPVSGDRRLLVGRAYEDNGLADTIIERLPTNVGSVFIDDAASLRAIGDFDLSIVNVFGDTNVYRYRLTTGALTVVSALTPTSTNIGPELLITDLIVYQGQPCLADFNNDGILDFFDIIGFVGAFSQGCE